jgi:hypothetical protein
VVLLGAGAAMPWDASGSKKIMDKFKEKFVYDDCRMLFDIFVDFYDGEKDYFNFETFLAAVEEVLNFVIASTNENRYASNTSFTPSVLQLKNEIDTLLENKSNVEKRKYCFYIFSKYINIIFSEIKRYNDNVLDDRNKEVNHNLVKFTKYFLKRNYAVKFYTTNYDNIIPQVLGRYFNVYEGFINPSSPYKRFNYDLDRFRKACLSHFNLHGSIFLRKKMMFCPESKYETVYDLNNNNFCDSLNENSGNPGELLSFSPIITGYNKTQRTSNLPFDLGFQAFANDCNDCKAIVTVGCSFSDPHINSKISNFIKWDKTIMLDVNPSSEFQNKDYYLSQFVTKEKNGNWIHDVSGKKHIYKGVFDDFLSNSDNWKCLINKCLAL